MASAASASFETLEKDPRAHLSLDELVRRLDGLALLPTDSGRVVLLVARGEAGERATVGSVDVSPGSGLSGDRWAPERSQGEGRFGKDEYLDMQIATMQAPVAELVANGQPLALFGDNLFLDLDLSSENLPTGSRLRIGSAAFEVTPFPHNGCAKFKARFGAAALRFVSEKSRRERNLRGIYLRVVEAGRIEVGDKAEVISRP